LTRRRGFVYYARLEGVADPKTVLVVSWNAINDGLRQPVCAVVSSTDRERTLPTHVELTPGEGGVRERCWVLCHSLYTLTEAALDSRPLGDALPPWRMGEVERALARALDFPGKN
jgi:mRNA-degrading endonuclease toxin of MazEF toxin-antitoxin module